MGEIMMSIKIGMVILMTTLFVILPIFQLAQAEVFKWVDEKGTIHFTEDPATIPEKYRDNAKSRVMEEEPIQPRRKSEPMERSPSGSRETINTEKEQFPKRTEGEPQKTGEETISVPSPGYIPFEKFKHITKGMTEAEVLSRLGSPTREEQGEMKSKGRVSGGSVSGFVDSGGHFSGTASGGSFRGETIVVKRYYYIGDRSKGEQTRVITFEKGKVVSYQSISP
jgi:hypothetical protein